MAQFPAVTVADGSNDEHQLHITSKLFISAVVCRLQLEIEFIVLNWISMIIAFLRL